MAKYPVGNRSLELNNPISDRTPASKFHRGQRPNGFVKVSGTDTSGRFWAR